MLPHTGAPPSLPSDPVLSLLPSPWYHLPYLPAVRAPVAAGYTSHICKKPSFTKGCVSATTLNQPAKFLQGIENINCCHTVVNMPVSRTRCCRSGPLHGDMQRAKLV